MCRWADKFCLHPNIFIYSRHIWIKPVLCSRMVSLFHHTSPWTHTYLQSSPSARRNGGVFRRSVQIACCYWILNRGKSSSNWNSQTNASRLWWSVCWCEYSLRRWARWSLQWGNGLKKKHQFFCKDGFKKNQCSVGGNALKCMVLLYKNNYAALKITEVGIFFFLFFFIKISFPVHFLFKWRQNLSARPRTIIAMQITVFFDR